MRVSSTASWNCSGSSVKPGAMTGMSQGMAARAMAVKISRPAARTAIASSANRFAASLPSSSSLAANSGTKAALNAPSAKRRRKRLGKRKATKKASATGPVPRTEAIRMSRMKPRTRLTAVSDPTVAKARSMLELALRLPGNRHSAEKVGVEDQKNEVECQPEGDAPPTDPCPIHRRASFRYGLKGEHRGGELDRAPAGAELQFPLPVDLMHAGERKHQDTAHHDQACQITVDDHVAARPKSGTPQERVPRDADYPGRGVSCKRNGDRKSVGQG